jgi:multimeric flavodoxin WrbA
VIEALEGQGVTTGLVRVADYDVRPGVSSDEGDGDQWPRLGPRSLDAEILVMASPTWLGQPSSVAKRVLERMDEDGAHHVINEIAGALIDIGFTVPGQAWTYWNMGPGPGPS